MGDPSGSTGVPPVIPPNPPARRRCRQITTSSPILEDALAAVLATDEESHLDEPCQHVLSRMDRLYDEAQARLDAAQNRGHP